MEYFSWANCSNGRHEFGKQGAIVVDPVLLHVDDDDAKREVLEIVLELKASIYGYEDVETSLYLIQ